MRKPNSARTRWNVAKGIVQSRCLVPISSDCYDLYRISLQEVDQVGEEKSAPAESLVSRVWSAAVK